MSRLLVPVLGALLALSSCGSPESVAPPLDSVGMETPSDTSGRTARVVGRWLSDAASMPNGAIRMEISTDGTYKMRLLQTRGALVDTILSASAGDISWTKAGFLQGRDDHAAPDMKRFATWAAGFSGDESRILMTPARGKPVTFEREPQ